MHLDFPILLLNQDLKQEITIIMIHFLRPKIKPRRLPIILSNNILLVEAHLRELNQSINIVMYKPTSWFSNEYLILECRHQIDLLLRLTIIDN